MPWHDHRQFIEVDTPRDFSFVEGLVYLGRSSLECMHRVKGGALYRRLRIDTWDLVVKIEMPGERLCVHFLNATPPQWARAEVAHTVWAMFDLGVEIDAFYELAEADPILRGLCRKYRGLRIVKMEDLFEALCWAIIGQQITLGFAYTMKRRLVETYGQRLVFGGEPYYLFPTPQALAPLAEEDLRVLQFSRSKAGYIIEIARRFDGGQLRQTDLADLEDYQELKARLMALKGVGPWTADYVILKCFRHRQAFPIADVGLQRALQIVLGRDNKPSLSEIRALAKPWTGWEAYAAFYLWRVLYD